MEVLDWAQTSLREMTSNDLGIDLGTANTLVYLGGKGIVVNEPSVVAVNKKTNQIVDVGTGAKEMLGRTPAHIQALTPLEGGVISEFEIAEEMVGYLLARAQQEVGRTIFGPRVVVGVPSDITNVQQRAVRDATKNAGARDVYIVEEPMAAALGMQLDINDPGGNMIIDIGGGTTDIALISMNGLVAGCNLHVAGDMFNQDIISYIREEYKVLIGEKTAENIKTSIGYITPPNELQEMTVRGRDLVSGLPEEVTVSDEDVRTALAVSIDSIIEATRQVLEDAPPEIVSDVLERGIHLVGGGAKLAGLDTFLAKWLAVDIHTAADPLTAVARGTGVMLENTSQYEELFITENDAIPSEQYVQ